MELNHNYLYKKIDMESKLRNYIRKLIEEQMNKSDKLLQQKQQYDQMTNAELINLVLQWAEPEEPSLMSGGSSDDYWHYEYVKNLLIQRLKHSGFI